MRRLTAMDAQFLYAEELRPAAHQHTLKVSIMDTSGAAEPYSFETTKEAIRERLDRLPPFRWRLVKTPFEIHNPSWVEDPDFDLDFHVRRVGCPAPGGITELCELISDIAGRPLDRTKPLWELFVVEGLEQDRIATIVKMHHALADGVASSQLLDMVYDAAPADPALPATPALPAGPASPAPTTWRPEKVPSKPRLLAAGIAEMVRESFPRLPAMVRAARDTSRHNKTLGLSDQDLPPKMYDARPTFSNGLLTPHRRFTMVSVPLEHLKEIRAAQGTTINDVVLAIAAGGLRRYHLRHGLPVDHHLVGSVPVSTRAPGERPAWGNHLAKIYLRLPIEVADPLERLQAARRHANVAKAELERTLGSRLENWLEFMPPWFLRNVLGKALMAKAKRGAISENLIVSNVPGPRSELHIGGSKVVSFFSMGPLTETIGLNITAWSYVDQMNVCLLACREFVPDLWALTADLHAAYVELYELVGGTEPAPAPAGAPGASEPAGAG